MSTTTFLTAKLTGLKAERDRLLREPRTDTAAWRASYLRVTAKIDSATTHLRWADTEPVS